MEITMVRDVLLTALKLTEKSGNNKSTLPILMCTLLRAEAGQLVLTATNLERGVRVTTQAQVTQEGSFAVPTQLFGKLIDKLYGDTVKLALNPRTMTLTVSTSQSNVQVKGMDPADFPLVPTVEELLAKDGAMESELDTQALIQAINQVAFAASTDGSRPTLNGIYTVLTPEYLQLATTDGYRLARRKLELAGTADIQSLIPASSLGEYARIADAVGDPKGVTQLVFSENQFLARFQGDNKKGVVLVEVISQLLEGRFPDYTAIIPKTHTYRMQIDTGVLTKAVNLAMLFAEDHANIMQFTLQPEDGSYDSAQPANTLTVSAISAELGESRDVLPTVRLDGDPAPVSINFNGKYLGDLLAQIPEAQLVMEMTQPTRPGVFYAPNLGADALLYVVMPMHPNGK